jgi:hypothetical protein
LYDVTDGKNIIKVGQEKTPDALLDKFLDDLEDDYE